MSSITSPFGQNEWLVEEMYRKFRDDPSSVDPSWHEFLVDYNPGPADRTALPPRPAPPATARDGTTATGPRPAPRRRPRRLDSPAPRATARPAPEGRAEDRRPPRRPKATRCRCCAARPPPSSRTCRRRWTCRPRPACAPIPAKLMIDNRIVINNHLKRTRGGKISFTHLLGLRDGAGGQEVPEHEPALRRGRRQAERRSRRRTPTWAWRSTCRARTASGPGGGRHQALPRTCASRSSSPPTKTSCAVPATAS